MLGDGGATMWTDCGAMKTYPGAAAYVAGLATAGIAYLVAEVM